MRGCLEISKVNECNRDITPTISKPRLAQARPPEGGSGPFPGLENNRET